MARSGAAWDYTEAIRGSAWHEARQLLSALEAKALEPNVISFNAALSASRWQDAGPMLQWMGRRHIEADLISLMPKPGPWTGALQSLASAADAGHNDS